MARHHQISASILSADFARLGEEVDAVLKAGADRIHVDVMDNHYVPNITFGPLVCEALRRYGVKAPMDVHLMVEPVDDLIRGFAKAGADCIVFHPQASKHVDRSLQLIKDEGCEAGLVLNIATPITVLEHVLDKLDRILLMSVNPGFGGQKLIPAIYRKTEMLCHLLKERQCDIPLEVDGGVKAENIAQLAKAGIDIFVAGSAIFGADNYQKAIAGMRAQLCS